MLSNEEVLFFGASAITPSEQTTIQSRGLPVIDLAEVHRDPTAAAERAVRWGSRFDSLLVHLDMDVLSYTSFPIAENVRREDGLSLTELSHVLQVLASADNLAGLTITEVNPDHAPDGEATFEQLIGVLERAFSRAVVRRPQIR